MNDQDPIWIEEKNLKSWEEFIPLMQKDFHHSPGLVYRGQADAKWKVASALDRLEARFPKRKSYVKGGPEFFNAHPATRELHLEAFKESVRSRRGQNPPDLTEDEWWALAQHHGLATPLLDWAYSPFVALYFAFEEKGLVDWGGEEITIPDHRAVYAASYLIAETNVSEIPAPILFSPRREISIRLSSQSGVLMRMPQGTDLESNVDDRFTNSTDYEGPLLTKIVIPNSNDDRIDCLKLLDRMNINRMSLFPDLDGASRHINNLWELDFHTGLGQFPSATDVSK